MPEARTQTIQISKRNGSLRTIYVPNQEYKAELRNVCGRLERKARYLDKDGVIHGFARYRSPVTMAKAHIDHLFTLSMDLKDFFDHVTPVMLNGKLSKDELALVIEDGAARQGLPTSPAVANIAFSAVDKAILKALRKAGKNAVYTRYADDLVFSFDEPGLEVVIEKIVRENVSRAGFKVNDKKTSLQTSKTGRRIITGIGVDENGIYPTREMKRRLRAALHQQNIHQAQGLAEVCKVKTPRQPPKGFSEASLLSAEEDVAALKSGWRLPAINFKKIPDRETTQISDKVVISADPAMYLGMSTFTTGWTSCMAQPSGQFRRGVLTWLYMQGSRIAYFAQPGDVVTIHGVTRPRMRARCLVHTLRDDDATLVYDKLYGNEPYVSELKKALEEFGVISIQAARKTHKGTSVVGHSPRKASQAYFDSLKRVEAVATDGFWKNRAVYVAKI